MSTAAVKISDSASFATSIDTCTLRTILVMTLLDTRVSCAIEASLVLVVVTHRSVCVPLLDCNVLHCQFTPLYYALSLS